MRQRCAHAASERIVDPFQTVCIATLACQHKQAFFTPFLHICHSPGCLFVAPQLVLVTNGLRGQLWWQHRGHDAIDTQALKSRHVSIVSVSKHLRGPELMACNDCLLSGSGCCRSAAAALGEVWRCSLPLGPLTSHPHQVRPHCHVQLLQFKHLTFACKSHLALASWCFAAIHVVLSATGCSTYTHMPKCGCMIGK